MSIELSSPQLSHIDHVNLVVQRLEPATDFFVDLGFEVKAGGSLSGAWIDTLVGLNNVDAEFVALALPLGQTVLELLKFNKPQSGVVPDGGNANQAGFRHVAFSVMGIYSWYKKLQDKHIECLSPVQDVPNYRGKRMFYFRGPENALLELAEYPDSV